ncbi:prolyl oligopeptidase family serine peptidase, partial [Algibacter sp.]|nr:prolyl oligopeptidase family serine peptidase [Algibacter sp.]
GWYKNQTITISGASRDYHMYLPANVTNAPIVILLHGNRSSNDELIGFTNAKAPYKAWEDIALQENLMLLVPNGTDGSSGRRGWNDCRNDADGNPDADDVLFINNLIDFVVNEHQADGSKVFAVGTSNGGHMAMRLAQEIPEKLTAFAAIVASNPVNSQCTNAILPISALFMNGTEDPINPYEGGEISSNRGDVFSAEDTINYWVNRNQTNTTPTVTDLADLDPDDSCTVKKHVYANGTNNTEVVFYEVIGGGHTEPSISERYSNLFKLVVKAQNGDIEMANEVWDFFRTK